MTVNKASDWLIHNLGTVIMGINTEWNESHVIRCAGNGKGRGRGRKQHAILISSSFYQHENKDNVLELKGKQTNLALKDGVYKTGG